MRDPIWIVLKIEQRGDAEYYAPPTGPFAHTFSTKADAELAAIALVKKFPYIKFAVFELNAKYYAEQTVGKLNGYQHPEV